MSTKVLILEDDPAVRRVIALILRRSGYLPLPVSSSKEALFHCETEDDTLKLMIADLTLAFGESGTEVALEAVDRRPNLRVLFTSGRPFENWSDEDTRNLRRLRPGSYSFILKPFPIEALPVEVATLLEGRPSMRRTA